MNDYRRPYICECRHWRCRATILLLHREYLALREAGPVISRGCAGRT